MGSEAAYQMREDYRDGSYYERPLRPVKSQKDKKFSQDFKSPKTENSKQKLEK